MLISVFAIGQSALCGMGVANSQSCAFCQQSVRHFAISAAVLATAVQAPVRMKQVPVVHSQIIRTRTLCAAGVRQLLNLAHSFFSRWRSRWRKGVDVYASGRLSAHASTKEECDAMSSVEGSVIVSGVAVRAPMHCKDACMRLVHA